jgi:hypothetical protein
MNPMQMHSRYPLAVLTDARGFVCASRIRDGNLTHSTAELTFPIAVVVWDRFGPYGLRRISSYTLSAVV